MMATDIIDMLEDIGRSATPRLSPAVHLSGDTTEACRANILTMIGRTVLPRRLEFTSADGTVLAIEVNSSRITDVYSGSTGDIPDFETEPRDALIQKLARMVSDLAACAQPIQVISLQPDGPLEADDVGVTFSEIQKACAAFPIKAEPSVAIVPDLAPETASDNTAEDMTDGLAQAFFNGADRFAMARLLIGPDAVPVQLEGACADGQPLHPTNDLLTRFASDLSGWDADSANTLGHPQLIVVRPAGGKGAAVALLRDGQDTAVAVHDARKLGAVVNLWKSLRGTAQ